MKSSTALCRHRAAPLFWCSPTIYHRHVEFSFLLKFWDSFHHESVNPLESIVTMNLQQPSSTKEEASKSFRRSEDSISVSSSFKESSASLFVIVVCSSNCLQEFSVAASPAFTALKVKPSRLCSSTDAQESNAAATTLDGRLSSPFQERF